MAHTSIMFMIVIREQGIELVMTKYCVYLHNNLEMPCLIDAISISVVTQKVYVVYSSIIALTIFNQKIHQSKQRTDSHTTLYIV